MKSALAAFVIFLGLNLSAADPCSYPGPKPALTVRPGFVEFISPQELDPLKQTLPLVENLEVNQALGSSETMWYDENSMVFLYQDSIESVVGGRANCVGREVGENPPTAAIGRLKNYFGPDYRFVFPFRKAAGTDNVVNEKVLNFWVPARMNGSVMPVKYWRPTKRSRWFWTFPAGTLFGEVLYQKAPSGKWYVFEIRTRKRYKDGWEVNLFRPFPTAQSLVSRIQKLRPDWAMSPNLKQVVQHLQNKNTLVPAKMESKAFASIFPVINGALDPIPEITDRNFVIRLLTETPFVSTEGKIWKENGRLETYAPGSQADFSIVPKGYEMGLIPVNEVSCNRCHEHTGRRLKQFDWELQLYGEIWGEDRNFTWHLFEPHQTIYGTFDDGDSESRKINPRFVQAGLVKNEKPAASDEYYKPLPMAYVAEQE